MKRLLLALFLLVPSWAWAVTLYQTAVLAQSPCTYWFMDATSGTTEVNNGSATGQNGTYVNSPTLNQSGIPNSGGDPAVKFASASSQYMTWSGTGGGACPITSTSIPTCNNGTPVNATVLAWVNPASLAAERVAVSAAGSSHYTFKLSVKTTGVIASTMWGDAGATYLDATGLLAVCSTGNWCMVGLKFTASGTTLRIYANGSPDTSANSPSGSCGGQQPSGNPRVGARGDASGFMDGTIDEVAWFDQALADATILSFYTLGSTVPATGSFNNFSVKAPVKQFPPHPRPTFISTFLHDPAYQTGGFPQRNENLFGQLALPISFGPQFPLRNYLGR